jgi:chorismate mutase/prephenate dehydratase
LTENESFEFDSEVLKIDAKILALATERVELLRKNSALAGSLAQHLQSCLHRTYGPESSQADLSAELVPSIAGATYQRAIVTTRIAYLGPEYSYSYSAASKFFGSTSGFQPVSSIGAVFDEIQQGQSTYGVVPIENSTDGRIVDTLTMFIRSPVKICGEVLLPIHHYLLAKCKRDEVREVYSKPQALSQCRGWLSEHLPQARWVEVASTAAAAKIASETFYAAAVASKEAGLAQGLDVVAPCIEDHRNNITRFAIIGNEIPAPTGNDKTSLMFQVPHKPGALADVMLMFRDNRLNLTWIESFPIPNSINEYFFFVELDGHGQEPNVAQAIASLQSIAIRLSILGSYPKGI